MSDKTLHARLSLIAVKISTTTSPLRLRAGVEFHWKSNGFVSEKLPALVETNTGSIATVTKDAFMRPFGCYFFFSCVHRLTSLPLKASAA